MIKEATCGGSHQDSRELHKNVLKEATVSPEFKLIQCQDLHTDVTVGKIQSEGVRNPHATLFKVCMQPTP